MIFWLGNKKICGILIETAKVGETNRCSYRYRNKCSYGTIQRKEIDQEWTSLDEISKEKMIEIEIQSLQK